MYEGRVEVCHDGGEWKTVCDLNLGGTERNQKLFAGSLATQMHRMVCTGTF